jgi:hypothetical protein
VKKRAVFAQTGISKRVMENHENTQMSSLQNPVLPQSTQRKKEKKIQKRCALCG